MLEKLVSPDACYGTGGWFNVRQWTSAVAALVRYGLDCLEQLPPPGWVGSCLAPTKKTTMLMKSNLNKEGVCIQLMLKSACNSAPYRQAS